MSVFRGFGVERDRSNQDSVVPSSPAEGATSASAERSLFSGRCVGLGEAAAAGLASGGLGGSLGAGLLLLLGDLGLFEDVALSRNFTEASAFFDG